MPLCKLEAHVTLFKNTVKTWYKGHVCVCCACLCTCLIHSLSESVSGVAKQVIKQLFLKTELVLDLFYIQENSGQSTI